ncbi:MAG: carboxylesterase family protein [Actinobacteria bacterium]|nr:carboxylesterase family protein [Actinomycetota bacterium]MSZ93983.1 carboxylesterase family protein [Actinomycetota bacterium]
MCLPFAMTTVSIANGILQGRSTPGSTAFLGIPFAEPPVGPLRWAPPSPALAWTGTRDATTFGPAPWQPSGGPLDGLVPGMGSDEQSDDCLNLNVWTPSVDDSRPVLVWIHGGAFSLGAGSLSVYDGSRLAAATNTVVVTINYRLGALGFLVIDDPSCTPNVGLLDQVAALEWVRDNISAFGGDPDNVTIFGESAGGGSVLSLLSMPSAVGLFQRAIIQSGATDLLLDRDKAQLVAEAVARAAGLETVDVDALRAMSGAQIIEAQANAAMELFGTVGTMPFHPVVDGVVLPHTWLEAASSGFNPVPVIIGTNRDEMDLFKMFDPQAGSLTADGLRTRFEAVGGNVDALIDAYRSTGASEPPEAWRRANTDIAMWLPALRIAEARSAHGPTWMYRFDWEASSPDMGSPHGVDIPFPFTTIDVDEWDTFVSDPEQAMSLASLMQRSWADFAAEGVPSLGDQDWPSYSADERATAILGKDVTVERDPNRQVRQAWNS